MRSTHGSICQDVIGPRPVRGRPRRLLFLSDCYLADDLWAPFHKSLLAHLGSAFGDVLAVRTNCFFHPWTHRPLSTDHLSRLCDEVREFDPDLIFSVNRCGLSGELLDEAGARADRITLFVDYY